MFTDYNVHDPGYPDTSAWAVQKLKALQAYREQADSDYSEDSDDEDSHVDSHNNSLEDIYNEIDQLQMIVAQRQAAPPPPPPRPQVYYPQQGASGIFPGNDVMMPSVTTSGGPLDQDQMILLKNLPKSNGVNCVDSSPFIDTLVIKEDVDVEYDAKGFPYVVPRQPKKDTANIISVPNPNEGQRLDSSQIQAEVPLGGTHTLQVDKPDPPPCPQHGPVETQGCPRHGVHCQQHCGAHAQQQAHPNVAHVGAPGACPAHGQPQPQAPPCQVHGAGPHQHHQAGAHHHHQGPPQQHVVQMGMQPTKQVVVRKRPKNKKGKTLFEQLIS